MKTSLLKFYFQYSSAIEFPALLRKQRQPDETVQPDGNQLVDFVAQQIAVSNFSKVIHT